MIVKLCIPCCIHSCCIHILHWTGKSWKIWKNKVVRELLFLQNVRELIKKEEADYCEIKKCHDFHQKNIEIIISCSR